MNKEINVNVWDDKVKCLCEYIIEILKYLDKDIFNDKEDFNVVNDEKAESPYFFRYIKPVEIRLNVKCSNYYCQVIYQLSHEMIHYLFYCNKKDKNIIARRYEEIVCEAMSIYILYIASFNWRNCCLAKNNMGYEQAIKEYYASVRNKLINGKEMIKEEVTLSEWAMLEEFCESKRESHSSETIAVLDALINNDISISDLIGYENYFLKEGMIDFLSWANSNKKIKIIEGIQPTVK